MCEDQCLLSVITYLRPLDSKVPSVMWCSCLAPRDSCLLSRIFHLAALVSHLLSRIHFTSYFLYVLCYRAQHSIPVCYVMPRISLTQLVMITSRLHFLVCYPLAPIAYLVAMLSYLIPLSWYLVPSIAYLSPLISYRWSDSLYRRSRTSPVLYPSPYLVFSVVISYLLVLIFQLAPGAYLVVCSYLFHLPLVSSLWSQALCVEILLILLFSCRLCLVSDLLLLPALANIGSVSFPCALAPHKSLLSSCPFPPISSIPTAAISESLIF